MSEPHGAPWVDTDTRLSVEHQLIELQANLEADLVHYRVAMLAQLDNFVNCVARLRIVTERIERGILMCESIRRELQYSFYLTDHRSQLERDPGVDL